MREGQILWGWPHCVQNEDITQLGIDRQLTLIAFEAMNHWHSDGSFNLHVFHKNNELAGYCSVLHAMQLLGITGEYGRPLRAAVISFGATGRGAVTALNAYGVTDVHVLTHREVAAVAAPVHSARMVHFDRDADDPARCHALGESGRVPLAAYLAGFDIVVNCVLQHTDAPLMFVTGDDLAAFSPGTLIVDVSCDAGMGFELGTTHIIYRPDVHRGQQHPLLRRGPQPVTAVELRDLGDQRSPAATPEDRARRPRRVGLRSDHPAGDRDPRWHHPELGHPVLSAPCAAISAPAAPLAQLHAEPEHPPNCPRLELTHQVGGSGRECHKDPAHYASITYMIRHYATRRAKVIFDHPHNADERILLRPEQRGRGRKAMLRPSPGRLRFPQEIRVGSPSCGISHCCKDALCRRGG